MDTASLEKMTVAQLREEAKKIPDVTGLSSMKKDDLIALVAKHSGTDTSAPKASAQKKGADNSNSIPSDKTLLKQRIRALKQEKQKALAAKDSVRARACNRQIHGCKRRLRRMATT